MSLKNIHIVLIVSSIALSTFLSIWLLRSVSIESQMLKNVLIAAVSLSDVLLVFYLLWFIKKNTKAS